MLRSAVLLSQCPALYWVAFQDSTNSGFFLGFFFLPRTILYFISISPDANSVSAVIQLLNINNIELYIAVGRGGVWALGSGHVSVEPACPACPLHVLLAGFVRPANVYLLQHSRPAHLQGEASLSFPHKVTTLYDVHKVNWLFLCMFRKNVCV